MLVFIRGGEREALDVIQQCEHETGNRNVGAPTIKLDWMRMGAGGTLTAIHISDDDDPNDWWSEWGHAHGLKVLSDKEVEDFMRRREESGE